MSRFRDVYIDPCVAGYPCASSPRFSTDLTLVDSGAEQANRRWEHPLHRFTVPEAVRDMETFNVIRDHWMVMAGPYYTWPWRDPLDFASVSLDRPNQEPVISDVDEPLGTGDGVTLRFQLYKTYARGAYSYRRKIELPITASVIVKGVDNLGNPVVLPDYTVTRPGGEVVFDTPPTPTLPATSIVLTCGFLFDVLVRFESDQDFDGIVRAFTLAGTSDLSFIETRVC